MDTRSITARSTTPKTTLSNLIEDFSGAKKTQHVRFDGERLHTHAKFAFSKKDIKAKVLSDPGAIKAKLDMRAMPPAK